MRRASILAASILALLVAGLASRQDDKSASKIAIAPIRAIGAIQPRISPDGSTIVFSYQRALWTTPRGGGTMSRLTQGEGLDTEPVWSPDGKRIALVRSVGGSDELRVIQADDGAALPLPGTVKVRGTIVNQKLEFHLDGRRILGVFRIDGKDTGLAWYDIQTGTATSLLVPPAWSRYALSPDGKSVIYTATMDVSGQQGGDDGPQADIFRVPAEGGKPEKLTRFPSRVHDLCFGADGKSLIVVTELGGVHYDLWQVPLANSIAGMAKLTFGQADEDRPSVSRDGRWLTYTDNHLGATSLVVRNLASGVDSVLSIDHLDFRRPTGKLRLAVRDGATKKAAMARVSIHDDKGKLHAPPGSLYRLLNDIGHFYGQDAELPLPAGKYRLRIYRGPEYDVHHQNFDIQPGQTLDLTASIERWTVQAAAGWYSGENHIHANYGYGQWYNTPRTMFQQCSGEDLNVCNFMVANSDTDGVFDRAFFRGGPDPLSTPETILYWNQEFRSTLWGHMASIL